MTFNPVSFVNFFAFADVGHTTNAIVNSQSVNSDLVRVTQPVNTGYATRINSNVNFGFPITRLGSRFNFGGTFRSDKSIALLNDVQNQIKQNTLGADVNYTYRYQETFDITVSADLNQQSSNYQFNQPDQKFINQTYSAATNLSFLKNYQFTGNFEYLIYSSKTMNYHRAIPLLNLAVSRFVLKNKTGEIKFAVNNLLNKAIGVNQTASVNYIEREITNSLGRYFMLSFTYALNKQLNPMGVRRGGMMRIMR
jgi:hypothetical protein